MCDASFLRRSHLNLAQTSQAFTAEEAKKPVPLPPAKGQEDFRGAAGAGGAARPVGTRATFSKNSWGNTWGECACDALYLDRKHGEALATG